jgi:hypothetical protein
MNAFVGERGGERVPQGVDCEPLVRKSSPSQERLKLAVVEVPGVKDVKRAIIMVGRG